MGKRDPDKNSMITIVTKNCDAHPSSGAQKGTAEIINKIQMNH